MSKLNPKVTAYGPWIVGVRAKNNSARKPVGGDGEASTRAMRSFRQTWHNIIMEVENPTKYTNQHETMEKMGSKEYQEGEFT